MANSTIPGLVAVSVPALTDLLGVRQSGDTRDKKLTVTQLLSLAPGGGDVTKVGTPVDNELGVWTGDGTLEGDTNLQWSGSRLTIAASGLILPAGSAAGPSQVFTGSLATGWYTPVANVISASIAGVQRWSFQADKFNSAGDGGTLNFTATDVIPGCIPRGTDLNTGIGGNGADTLTAIAGSILGQFWNETNAGVLSGYASSPAVTAFATGGQGGATVLINSYNIVTTVATTGDSVRLQGTHDLGSVVYCKNEGANSLDIFPASGDDLGAGVDTAVAIPAGEFKCFITTVAQSTWTELLPFAGGGGDVSKVGTPVNNQLGVWTGDGTLEGDPLLAWSGTILTVGGTIRVANNGGGAILNEQVSSTNPSIIIDVGDVDTGFGSGGTNNMAVILGAQTYATWRATGAGDGSLEATYDLTTGKVASTTQTQGQATQNSPEYSEITTVANPNDVITLGSAAAGRKITVVNRGANVLQIFPSSGGDLGQGLNASTTLAVGHSITWVGAGTAGVWAVIGFSDDQSGTGDVTKVGTPVNDQLAVWTGDGTLEGNANFNVVGTAFRSTLGNGPSMVNVSSTSGTVPSLIPRQGDPNTGVSNAGDDRIALTAGGVMAIRAIEAAAVISSIDLFGPTVVTGSIRVTDAAGPAMLNEAASATNPTLNPNRADADSGIGQNAVDQVSLIAGGVELLRVSDDGAAFMLSGTDAAADGGALGLTAGDSGVGATGDGGAVNIEAGASVATAGDGGAVDVKGGAGFFTGKGGTIHHEVGSGGAAGPGTSGDYFVNTTVGLTAAAGLQVPIPGLVSIYGVGRSGAGPAGNLELWGGYASGAGAGSDGGDLLLFGGGQGGGAGAGGNAHLYGGESDTTPGFAELEGGTATVGGPGGAAHVRGGPGFGTNQDGGVTSLIAGAGSAGGGSGGSAFMRGGAGGSGAGSGLGGGAVISGGASLATDGGGGLVSLDGGVGTGTGDGGSITISSGIAGGTGVDGNITLTTSEALALAGTEIGFYVTTPIALQTGVAVTAVAIHAALVALGLITA